MRRFSFGLDHLGFGILAVLTCLLAASPVDAQQRRGGEVMLTESFDVGPGGTLTVDVADASVEVETDGGTGVEIEVIAYGENGEWARDVFDRMRFEVEASGNTVTVRASDPRIRGREWARNKGAGVVAVIHVPNRFDVDVHSGDGNITVASINGVIDLTTDDGNITLADARSNEPMRLMMHDGNITTRDVAAPRIELHTRDGNVTTGNLDSPDTNIETSDGNLVVAGSRGRIDLATGDGNVEVRLDSFFGARISSGDGNVVVTAPRSLAAEVDLVGERLILDGFAIQGRVDRRRARGSVGGGGPTLEVRTSDGRVALRSSGG